MKISFADCLKMNTEDELKDFKQQFYLPKNKLYFDGNSLGPLPKTTVARMQTLVTKEWGKDLIQSWDTHDWLKLPMVTGDKIAQLIGVNTGEVIVADSTSVNLYKAIFNALQMNPKRKVILTEQENFPTDLYIMQKMADFFGGDYQVKYATVENLLSMITEEVAVLCLTQVNYRTGYMHDIEKISALAQQHGVLTVWDLSHSTGAVPLEINQAGVDFAVGCTYKFLNGGPGAPAYIFVAKKHHEQLKNPIAGWMGHERPFDFANSYIPADGIRRLLSGTPCIIGLTAVDAAMDILLQTNKWTIRKKSIQQTNLFLGLLEQECPHKFSNISPINEKQRGSQICLTHPNAQQITERLIAEGLIPDFRPPNIIRFGFSPLFLSYTDIWSAVQILAKVECDV